MTSTIHCGDSREVLATLPDASVQMCVTSPPYFGLRDYNVDGQIGLESTVDEFVNALVDVFREVRRVLADDGTLWLNLGDSYAGAGAGGGGNRKGNEHGQHDAMVGSGRGVVPDGLKPKDLIGIPWRVAFALQADGWYLRSDIIWSKLNPMPESVRDRCTKSHEYIFLLSKSPRYYYDAAAISEPVTASTIERLSQPTLHQQAGSDRVPGKTNGAMKAVRGSHKGSTFHSGKTAEHQLGRASDGDRVETDKRNKRSVWTVATQPFSEAHFATFPPKLIEPCILAGSREGDTILDPFGGAGTAERIEDRLNRNSVLIELNPEYAEMARRRIYNDAPMFASVEVLA